MPRPLVLVMVAAMVGCQKPADRSPPTAANPVVDSLARVSQAFFTTEKVPGLAVGVFQGGTVIYRAGFGSTIQGGGQPVTPSTLFHMASVTKPFVATAVMQLAREGKLSLDDPIRRYLPYFAMKDPRAAGITIRQTLTHTAGFPDVTDYRWNHPEYDDGALERYVRGLADSTLIFAPGNQWAYSNIGFEVLADLIAKVSEQPFEQYLQRRILSPLGMVKSTLLMTDIDSTLMAYGHATDSAGSYHRNADYPYNRRHAASSTLHSNVDDMLRWAAANLGRGTLDGATILPAGAYDELWKPDRDMTAELAERAKKAGAPMPYDRIAIGLSWFLLTKDGRDLVWHSGGDNGFRSDLVLVPAEQIAIVVMTNGENADPGDLAQALLRAIPRR